jgi:hypothetical protein
MKPKAAQLIKPVAATKYSAWTQKGEIVVQMTTRQFLDAYDNGGAFFVDQNGEFLRV